MKIGRDDGWIGSFQGSLIRRGSLVMILLLMPLLALSQVTPVEEISWERADRGMFDDLRLAVSRDQPLSDLRILLIVRPAEVSVLVEPTRKTIPGLAERLDSWRASQGLEGPVWSESNGRNAALSHGEARPGRLGWERTLDLTSLVDALGDLGTSEIAVATAESVKGDFISGHKVQDGLAASATITTLEPRVITPRADVHPLALLQLMAILTVFPATFWVWGLAARRLNQNINLTATEKRKRYQSLVYGSLLVPIVLHLGLLLGGTMNGVWELFARIWFQSPGTQILVILVLLGSIGLPIGSQILAREEKLMMEMSDDESWNLIRNETGEADQTRAFPNEVSADGSARQARLSLGLLVVMLACLVFIPHPQVALAALQMTAVTGMLVELIILVLQKRATARHKVAQAESHRRLTGSMMRCTSRLSLRRLPVAMDTRRDALAFSATIRLLPRALVVTERALTELTDDELDHLVLQALIWYLKGGLQRQTITLGLLYASMFPVAILMIRLMPKNGQIPWGPLASAFVITILTLVWARRTAQARGRSALAEEAEAIRVLNRPDASLSFLRKLAAACQHLPLATVDTAAVPSVARRIAQAEAIAFEADGESRQIDSAGVLAD